MHKVSVQRIKTASTTEILRKADTPEGKEGAGFSFLGFLPTVLTTS